MQICIYSYISKKYSKTNNKYIKFYDPKQKSKHFIYLVANNLYGKFLPTRRFKCLDHKNLGSNKHSSNSLKRYASEVDFEYPKLLGELNNDYSSAPDEVEINKEMLSNYQLDNFITFLLKIFKNWCPSFLINKKVCASLWKLATLKNTPSLEFNLSKWLKPNVEFNTQERIETEKNGDKDGKVLYKLINYAVYGKAIENLRD